MWVRHQNLKVKTLQFCVAVNYLLYPSYITILRNPIFVFVLGSLKFHWKHCVRFLYLGLCFSWTDKGLKKTKNKWFVFLFLFLVSVSQSGFLQLLKTEGANVAAASNSLPTPATSKLKKENLKKESGTSSAAAAGGAGWKVLQDDYLMGNKKLTDWDKAESSDEEEDG